MTNETTPDAVAMLKRMHARAVHSEKRGDEPRIGSDEVLAVLRATQAERARNAEEVAEARRQKELWRGLAKVTTAAEALERRLRELRELHRSVGRCLGLTNCAQDVTEADDDDDE